MPTSTHAVRPTPGPLKLLLVAALAIAANAVSAQTKSPAAAGVEKERAACLSGASQQDRDACLKEAGAAANERKQGKLGGPNDTEQAQNQSAAKLQENALTRCNALPLKDRADCEVRAKGGGKVEGSVGGGGIVKETVTRKVLPPGSAVPPDSKIVGAVPSSAALPGPASEPASRPAMSSK